MFGMIWYQGKMCLKRRMRPYGQPVFMPVAVTWESYYRVRDEHPEMFEPVREATISAADLRPGDYLPGGFAVEKAERTAMGVVVMAHGPRGPQGYLYDHDAEAAVLR